MDCISFDKLKNSEYKDFGFYIGLNKLDLENVFLFDRASDNKLIVYFYMASNGVVVNDSNGKGMFSHFELLDAEFKAVDSSGYLVNIENWVIENGLEHDGASNFLGH